MAETPLVAVLAAGSARRFGGGKLDALCAGKRLGRWVLDAAEAAGLTPGIVIGSSQEPRFASGTAWECVANSRATEGLGTSLALAARIALLREQALLVLLADMPLIDAAYLRELASAASPAATAYPDRDPGVPALFGRADLPALVELSGDRGAAALLSLMEGLTVLQPPAGMLRDVDRPEDLADVEQLLG